MGIEALKLPGHRRPNFRMIVALQLAKDFAPGIAAEISARLSRPMCPSGSTMMPSGLSAGLSNVMTSSQQQLLGARLCDPCVTVEITELLEDPGVGARDAMRESRSCATSSA